MDNFYQKLKNLDPRDKNMVLKVVAGSLAGQKALLVNGDIKEADPAFTSFLDARMSKGGSSRFLSLIGTGLIDEDGQTIYYEEITGERKLVICGAGHVGLALIRLAGQMKYHVTVIDDREAFVQMARQAGADEVLLGPFAELLATIPGNLDTAFVIVTRGHCNDLASLKVVLKKEYAYVGVMGSRKKTAVLKEKLLEDGFDQETIGKIHMPIGLKIGGQSPEEIAVAILGEIIQVYSGKDRRVAFSKDMLDALCLDERLRILATVIRKEGSGPRDAGAKMLLYPDGKTLGTVGGGMVEALTIHEAREMFTEQTDIDQKGGAGAGQVRILPVDLDGATVEAGKMICGGRMEVFLELLSSGNCPEEKTVGPDIQNSPPNRLIYLDNAATTMIKPPEVIRAVSRAMTSYGNAGRGAHGESLEALRGVHETRQLLSDLFHTKDPSRIAFSANSTQALNMAIKGVLSEKDHVISTVLEHNSVLRPLYECEKRGTQISLIACDGQGRPDYRAFEKEIKSNTKAIVCTHASNLTGNLVDIAKVGRIARKHGLIFIVDASQTAGYMDIDVEEMNIDILCFTGHKSLLGPQGTGGIYVREGIHVNPLITGGSGIRTYEKDHPHRMPEALEAGTLNGHGIAGLGAGISFLKQIGLATIREKEEGLMRLFYEGIRRIPGVKIYGDFSSMNRCPIVTFNIRKEDSGRIADALYEDYGIAVRAGGHCAPLMHQALGTAGQGAVRVSFSWFNKEQDAYAAVKAVQQLAKEII